MSSVFKSGTSLFTVIVFWGTILLLLGLFINDILSQQIGSTFYFHIFDFLIIGLLLWIWFKTNYAFTGNDLICKAGPFNANIDIKSIRKVDLRKKMWAGFRPALDFKGIVIHYEKYNEIFISPKDTEGFISVLLRMNPTIKIIES
ncbi:MAG: PH domain-containing protein [Bacteroidia bacterium]